MPKHKILSIVVQIVLFTFVLGVVPAVVLPANLDSQGLVF